MSRTPRSAAASLVACTLLAFALACQSDEPAFRGEVVEPPEPAPELVGTNWNGEPFRLSQLEGHVVVVFFGYTYCPDICPFTLAKMQQVERRLGEQADELEMVFVTVDPHRDPVEKLATYVPNFDRSFYGIYIPAEDLPDVTDAFGVTVQYGQPKEGPGTDSFYYVDHTGTYFVIDRQGRLRLKFPPNATVDELTPDLEALLAE
jgi:protein SCO1/2